MLMFRRRFVTDQRYQFGFAFSLLRGFMLAAGVPAAVFLSLFVYAFRSATPQQRDILLASTPSILAVTIFCAALISGIIALAALYLSHKYIGPLRRIEAWSARVLLGTPPEKLSLRSGDELSDVAAGLTNLAQRKQS